MRSLLESRYAKLTYPIHGYKGDIREKWPELLKIPGFDFCDEENKIKYIIYLYDRGSELIYEIKDLKDRKEVAAQEAGYKRSKGGSWPKNVGEMFSMQDTELRNMVISYLHYHNYRALTMIHYTEQLFVENTRLLMHPIMDKGDEALTPASIKKILEAADIKKKLREENIAIKEDLDSLYREIYHDNEDVINEAMSARRTTPEAIGQLKAS